MSDEEWGIVDGEYMQIISADGTEPFDVSDYAIAQRGEEWRPHVCRKCGLRSLCLQKIGKASEMIACLACKFLS